MSDDMLPKILNVEEIELFIQHKSKSNDSILILCFIFVILILISNGFLIFYTYKKRSKLTDLDKMMCLDSVFCMVNIVALIRTATKEKTNNLFFCYTLDFFLLSSSGPGPGPITNSKLNKRTRAYVIIQMHPPPTTTHHHHPPPTFQSS